MRRRKFREETPAEAEARIRAKLQQLEMALRIVKTCRLCGFTSNLDHHIDHMLTRHCDVWAAEIAKCEEAFNDRKAKALLP